MWQGLLHGSQTKGGRRKTAGRRTIAHELHHWKSNGYPKGDSTPAPTRDQTPDPGLDPGPNPDPGPDPGPDLCPDLCPDPTPGPNPYPSPITIRHGLLVQLDCVL